LEITQERKIKFENTIAARQHDITVVLENVHDPHNIGAVLRSCDSVGVSEIYVLYNQKGQNFEHQLIGLNSASGSLKWVKVHFYTDTDACFVSVKSKYEQILGTHLSVDSKSLYQLDLSTSVALVFGNERDGISDEAIKYLDGNFIIPQFGLVKSLNISVACAVSLFEASRQRSLKGMYDKPYDENNPVHISLFKQFIKRHFERLEGGKYGFGR